MCKFPCAKPAELFICCRFLRGTKVQNPGCRMQPCNFILFLIKNKLFCMHRSTGKHWEQIILKFQNRKRLPKWIKQIFTTYLALKFFPFKSKQQLDWSSCGSGPCHWRTRALFCFSLIMVSNLTLLFIFQAKDTQPTLTSHICHSEESGGSKFLP